MISATCSFVATCNGASCGATNTSYVTQSSCLDCNPVTSYKSTSGEDPNVVLVAADYGLIVFDLSYGYTESYSYNSTNVSYTSRTAHVFVTASRPPDEYPYECPFSLSSMLIHKNSNSNIISVFPLSSYPVIIPGNLWGCVIGKNDSVCTYTKSNTNSGVFTFSITGNDAFNYYVNSISLNLNV